VNLGVESFNPDPCLHFRRASNALNLMSEPQDTLVN